MSEPGATSHNNTSRNIAHSGAQIGFQADNVSQSSVRVTQSAVTHNSYYGTRPYALEEFPRPADLDMEWLKEQPSRLLDARSQVVGFLGREAELRQLQEWRDSGTKRLSVRLLHAPGGQGKTRLATEFARRSREQPDRWQVLQAQVGAGPAEVADDSASAGVLVIVDYAEMWAHSELVRLLSDPLLQQPKPVRVLLIGRTVRWYAALCGELAEGQWHASTDDVLLSPLQADRMSMFAAARNRFCQPDLYDLPGAAITPPGSLDDPDFGLALTVQMAALVAVDAHKSGRTAPASPHQLSAYLLNREFLAWQRLRDAEREGQDYETKPTDMAKVVFAAALTGALDHDLGEQVMRLLNIPGHPQRLLDDHRFRYPTAGGEHVLQPLYPDRLAEDYLALLTPGHDVTAYEPQPWANSVPAKLLAPENSLRPMIAPRAVTTLTAAAARWPHLRENVLQPLLMADASVALDAGNAGLSGIARTVNIDLEVIDAIDTAAADRFGYNRHIYLDTGLAEIASRRADGHTRARDVSLNALALMWSVVSTREANAGNRAEALMAAEILVEMARVLAEEYPDTDRAVLAEALSSLGARLSEDGRHAEALAAMRETLTIYRELTTAQPGAHEYELAATTANIAAQLSYLDRSAEALPMVEQSLAVFRRLAAEQPDQHLGDLANGLTNLAATLLENSRWPEAVEASAEAVALWRRLAEAVPHAHLPRLAQALALLGRALERVNRWTEARAATEEAVSLQRQFSTSTPKAHLRDLASSTYLQARLLANGPQTVHSDGQEDPVELIELALSRGGEKTDAWPAAQETVDLYRQLVETDPGTHLPHLAQALYNLSGLEAVPERARLVIAAALEASVLFRRLAADDPGRYERLLADSLRRLGLHLNQVRDYEGALAPLTERLAIERRLARGGDDEGLLALADAYNVRRCTLSALGCHTEALRDAEATVEICRRRAANAQIFVPHQDLASALRNLATAQADAGRLKLALKTADESVDIYRTLIQDHAFLLAHWAAALQHRGELQARAEQWARAVLDIGTAVILLHRLALSEPTVHQESLISALHSLRRLLRMMSDQRNGLELMKSAVSISLSAADATDGELAQPLIAHAVSEYARLRAAQGIELQRSVRETLAAVQIFSDADKRLPGAFKADIEAAQEAMAEVLESLADC